MGVLVVCGGVWWLLVVCGGCSHSLVLLLFFHVLVFLMFVLFQWPWQMHFGRMHVHARVLRRDVQFH